MCGIVGRGKTYDREFLYQIFDKYTKTIHNTLRTDNEAATGKAGELKVEETERHSGTIL
jgi:hypothetical protein